ncbi:acyl-CoA oxidase [Microthyrium microscopicum]|uniref:Acyl-coenzyme A oxidase n=1 Tax=Microthyrium microscopicum TaxID=703497 RepID=A0A6A6U633_9PEZI|nr:acyl-CoA oxidase [Microthyrium microscopicum]
MAPVPPWVKKLRPAEPLGSQLLDAERAKSSIPVDKLTLFLYGQEFIDIKAKILKILQAEPLFDKSQNYFQGRVERWEKSLARAKRLRQLAVEHDWSLEDHNVAVDLIAEPIPYMLHGTMFLLTLFSQCSDEQGAKYFMRAMDYKIIGCYAQTELGHGSNVKGLETTATWNSDDKTFTIHSPTLTASKWWIGTLGRTANHAVVMAQLIVNGKNHGPHPFIVKIRDMKTHQPLENIHVGDVGPKIGYNTMDNGFLLFNNHKVPHEAMLAKFSSVDPETNQYVPPKSAAQVYGTMTWVRSTIVWQSGGYLARGVTIAVRYCAVRRQFKDEEAPDSQKGETQVLDYSMVAYRLLPLLAACYALHFTGKIMMDMYQQKQGLLTDSTSKQEQEFAIAELADLHATSCGLKSLASTTTADGLETSRRACGGHGYSSFSGIGDVSTNYLPNVTWEGDNYMLTQQVARYLIKTARSVMDGAPITNDTTKIFSYYQSRAEIGAAFDVLGSDTDLVAAFAWRSAYLSFDAMRQRDEAKKPWNDLLVDFYRLSKAHSQYFIVKNFYDTLVTEDPENALDDDTKGIMYLLFRLYALHTLESEANEFFTSSALTVHQITLCRATVMRLLKEIRPHAVTLVDAWDFPDFQLDSSLGRKDGDVYSDMFYRASELNPLNDLTADPYPDSPVIVKSRL